MSTPRTACSSVPSKSRPTPATPNDEVLVEAIYNLLEVCFFGGRADLWPPFHRAIERLEPHAPTFLELLAETIPDPARDAVGRARPPRRSDRRAEPRVEPDSHRANRGRQLLHRPACRNAARRCGESCTTAAPAAPVTMSIQALALLGFDAFLTGQWDSLAEMADEASPLCDTHGYGLLRWPARSLQALLAAGTRRQRRTCVRSPTRSSAGRCLDEPERCSNYVLHARSARRHRTWRLRERVPRRLRDQPRRDHRVARSARDVDGVRPRRGRDANRPHTTRPPPMSQPRRKPACRRSRHGSR